jgi:hypothetical protein
MDYLIYQTVELEALNGLPHIQQIAYFAGIRPYIDFSTGIVGIRRRISYQSIKEAVYIAPAPGIKSPSHSREQIRRAVKALERVGLIIIQSDYTHLILKCPLAMAPKSDQNKPDIIPTPETTIPKTEENIDKPMNSEDEKPKANILEPQEADTHHYSSNNNYIIFLRAQYEKFCFRYPRKNGKQNTWNAFMALQPDEALLTRIFIALEEQLLAEKQQKALGLWVPHWKNAANWITKQCWEDEIDFDWIKEQADAKSNADNAKQSSGDWYWEACKSGADYDFDSEPTDEAANSKVIDLSNYRE